MQQLSLLQSQAIAGGVGHTDHQQGIDDFLRASEVNVGLALIFWGILLSEDLIFTGIFIAVTVAVSAIDYATPMPLSYNCPYEYYS